MNEATKIIAWALKSVNSYGAHIEALSQALKSDRISEETRVIITEKQTEWVNEHNSRMVLA